MTNDFSALALMMACGSLAMMQRREREKNPEREATDLEYRRAHLENDAMDEAKRLDREEMERAPRAYRRRKIKLAK